MTPQQASKNRQAALRRGDTTYEAMPCVEGHTTRYTSTRACAECERARARRQMRPDRAAGVPRKYSI